MNWYHFRFKETDLTPFAKIQAECSEHAETQVRRCYARWLARRTPLHRFLAAKVLATKHFDIHDAGPITGKEHVTAVFQVVI